MENEIMDMRGKNRWGEDNPMWKGGQYFIKGRKVVKAPDCSRKFYNGYAQEHIVVAEKTLGKSLPKDAVVHHVNGKKAPNVNSNLVVCENDSYHRRLHMRMRALKACGNANWRKCTICKEYDEPENLYCGPSGGNYHRVCKNIINKISRAKRRKSNE